MSGEPEIYIAARRALLDALVALDEHIDSLILVGAQAIYLHTGEADIAVAATTKDSDIVLNPTELKTDPKLGVAMENAGFQHSPRSGQPGEWVSKEGIPVDLLVPSSLGGPGRRGARIPPHEKTAARKVLGLEASLIDNDGMAITALDNNDERRIEMKVAGPTALLIAKLHKLGERKDEPKRLNDKDAHDIYRLLREFPTTTFVGKFRMLSHNDLSSHVTLVAMDYLRELFMTPSAQGAMMAGRAEEGIGRPEEVALSSSVLAEDIMKEFDDSQDS